MKHVAKMAGVVFAGMLLLFSFLWFNNDIGVSKNFIEKDARGSSKIKDDWQVAKDTSDTLAAMVFYPEDKSDHSFQIYVNRPGLSCGYFFRGGGSIAEVENYIAEFTVEGCNDRAFVSINTQKVALMEIDNGNAIKKINIDSSKPFAFVLPKNVGNITFFDINNNAVDTMSHPL